MALEHARGVGAPELAAGRRATAPATGRPWSIRAMLTVKCGSPRTNALVPSSGSTRKKRGADGVGRAELAGVLLGDHRHAGKPPRQACQDQRLGPPVGLGDRALVGLGARPSASVFHSGRIRRGGLGGDVGEVRADVGGIRRGAMGHRLYGAQPAPVSQSGKSGRFAPADEPVRRPRPCRPAREPQRARPSRPRSWPRGSPPSSATTSSARPARIVSGLDLLDDPAGQGHARRGDGPDRRQRPQAGRPAGVRPRRFRRRPPASRCSTAPSWSG